MFEQPQTGVHDLFNTQQSLGFEIRNVPPCSVSNPVDTCVYSVNARIQTRAKSVDAHANSVNTRPNYVDARVNFRAKSIKQPVWMFDWKRRNMADIATTSAMTDGQI